MSELRCAVCDGREAARRGWDECGPDLVGFDGHHYATPLPMDLPKLCVTWSGTYMHATANGKKTLCGRSVVNVNSEPADPADELLCEICRKAVKSC